jgi:hypothetical protein
MMIQCMLMTKWFWSFSLFPWWSFITLFHAPAKILLTTLAHNQHDIIDVIWRLLVWNLKIRNYLASCTLQFLSNLTKISFQGKHFNYFCVLLLIWQVGFLHFQDGRSFQLNPLVSLLVDLYVWNEIYK